MFKHHFSEQITHQNSSTKPNTPKNLQNTKTYNTTTASLPQRHKTMKFGSYTFQPQKPQGFDFHVLRVKPETGIRLQPQKDMYSNLALFADTLTGQNHPDWISQSPLGPAKFGNNNFNIYWSVLCATQPEYREEQLKYIAEVDRQSPGIWLNSQYFAEHDHCTCPRCQERHAKSGLGWLEWRRKEITEYMTQIRDVVKKELVFCIQPDPVSAYERYGVDFDDFAKSRTNSVWLCLAKTMPPLGTGKCLPAHSRNC